MDDKARLQLQEMIKANNVEDQTSLIRELKHSRTIRNEINTLLMIKQKYGSSNESEVNLEAMVECNFLFTYYTDIYNKIRKDEIDLTILYKFLDVLQEIEEGKLDQHEGSFKVGSLLKEIYVDSALRKADKLEKEREQEEPKEEYKQPEVAITWKEFKKQNNISLMTAEEKTAHREELKKKLREKRGRGNR